MTSVHTLSPSLLERRVRVDLVGCGGSGSRMLTGLACLDRAMRACGHPGGLEVRAWDPDSVSEANIGRQLFYPADLGRSKAEVLVHRINCSLGLDWTAFPLRYQGEAHRRHRLGAGMLQLGGVAGDVLITCVDTARARREIHQAICEHDRGSGSTPAYWLDLGNRQQDGQVILGEPVDRINARGRAGELPRLPTVVEVFPELLDPALPEDDRPSCSLAEALESQDLFINLHVSAWALELLSKLFRRGRIEHHGYFINLATGQVNPLPVPAGGAA